MTPFTFKTIKEKYTKLMAESITVLVEDLSNNEKKLIDESFLMFDSKLNDIKELEGQNKRLIIALANLRSMTDDNDYNYDSDDNH